MLFNVAKQHSIPDLNSPAELQQAQMVSSNTPCRIHRRHYYTTFVPFPFGHLFTAFIARSDGCENDGASLLLPERVETACIRHNESAACLSMVWLGAW